jgi:3-methyladenine DNA glycosylase AlkD
MKSHEILERLRALSNPENVKGMARFGINPENTLGVSMPRIREIAGEAGKCHAVALELWESGIHEARILASLVEIPALMKDEQVEQWVSDIDSWDVCDQLCMNLLRKTSLAFEKAEAWCSRAREFERRAGFSLIATLAVHEKKKGDEEFVRFLALIKKAAADERNFVKKSVNWALRQIGKRTVSLNEKAVALAEDLTGMDSKSARWIGKDALRELRSEAVKTRLLNKEKHPGDRGAH